MFLATNIYAHWFWDKPKKNFFCNLFRHQRGWDSSWLQTNIYAHWLWASFKKITTFFVTFFVIKEVGTGDGRSQFFKEVSVFFGQYHGYSFFLMFVFEKWSLWNWYKLIFASMKNTKQYRFDVLSDVSNLFWWIRNCALTGLKLKNAPKIALRKNLHWIN